MKRNKPLRARSLDLGALQTVNGGKPLGGYTTASGRGTIHGYVECNVCGASFVMTHAEAASFVCPICGGVEP